MKALCWEGVNRLSVERVPDPQILNDQDAIVKVTLTTTCGSDLHLINGYIPTMQAGDVIGHEFMGEIVDIGRGVRRRKVGERVVVCSFIGCGRCWYCTHDLWSLCDNTNPNWELAQDTLGFETGGVYGYSHAMGGFKGSHSEYIRVPFADFGTFPVPDGVSDLDALYASDAAPTGWMGAHMGGVKPGDVVAVWGAGGVGQMAARAAQLLGAERVIVIDRLPERLAMAERYMDVETIDFSQTDVRADLHERTGGRGPDVCIEAVGMEATGAPDGQYAYDRVKQQLHMQQDRPIAVREAIQVCAKGGSVFVLGVFGGMVDRFPLGILMNKGLVLAGAQQHGHRYIPMLLKRMASGELSASQLATHEMSLDDAPHGYDMFKHKKDGCVRVAFRPHD
ncbi:zinc-dependent alcohol dehydrogenase [Actinoallomurus iriomotensis]|uniref:Glutathione-dependent formaldehyde dehydrogenase n=1 Tax=Actinoallomurus iriomotensis TaxID=478107 RepID=A0A9W6RMD1_9ACTN|nr:zinc-dependent alcohol dehydrogenase [Actinoallomurus iriomotensis]GLY78866.1 glutathione-dependent formaldehyde dehydrogenase [Actinoallomurus iriomotensis]GLY92479.1 glutathione-dependent formaldehyde dehydrogenase [Actinoallomurus iriomotensis]